MKQNFVDKGIIRLHIVRMIYKSFTEMALITGLDQLNKPIIYCLLLEIIEPLFIVLRKTQLIKLMEQSKQHVKFKYCLSTLYSYEMFTIKTFKFWLTSWICFNKTRKSETIDYKNQISLSHLQLDISRCNSIFYRSHYVFMLMMINDSLYYIKWCQIAIWEHDISRIEQSNLFFCPLIT